MGAPTMLSSALVALVLMLSWPAAAGAEQATVKIDNFTFEPAILKVKAGATVTWINEDDIPHTVATTDRKFKSKAMDTDENTAFTFTIPGSYEYFCTLHPHMRGTIVVEGTTSRS
jgi:amicyanin